MRPCPARPNPGLRGTGVCQLPPTPPAPAMASSHPRSAPGPPHLLSPVSHSLGGWKSLHHEERAQRSGVSSIHSRCHTYQYTQNQSWSRTQAIRSQQSPAISSLRSPPCKVLKKGTESGDSIQFSQHLLGTCCMPGSVLELRSIIVSAFRELLG